MEHHVKQAPVQGVTGLWGGTQGALTSGGAADPVYVDDIFSTYLFTGNSSTQTITNGIDLAGEGGMVWCKTRGSGTHHEIADTERGTSQPRVLRTNEPDQAVSGDVGNSFTSTGFSLSFTSGDVNWTGRPGASWTFRKAPGFFDVVTYSGSGSTQTIAHSLGSTPGMIMVKCRTASENWSVYHRGTNANSSPEDYKLNLNQTDGASNSQSAWNDTAPTSTHFTVKSDQEVNGSGNTYVAYIFAHDEQSFGESADASVIKCGNYTGNGSTDGPNINVGWEPQWVMVKNTTTTGLWLMADGMRGVSNGANDPYLRADSINAEYTSYDWIEFTPTGFKLTNNGVSLNGSGNNYIYLAIRRPDGFVGKPVTTGTDVFAMDTGATSTTIPNFDSGFPVDYTFMKNKSSTSSWYTYSRLTQTRELVLNGNNSEGGASAYVFDSNVGWGEGGDNSNWQSWMWKRHAGFDVVTYTGDGSNSRFVNHSLGKVPEMIWIKRRDSTGDWYIYHNRMRTSGGNDWASGHFYMKLNAQDARVANSFFFMGGDGTTSTFELSSATEINGNGYDFLSILFASVAGVSKVGFYTGTGSDQTITTGFQPRFVLIKRADSGDSGFVLDTTRGWASGNDNYLRVENTAAQVGSANFGEPVSTGFFVKGTNSATNTNTGHYIYYAHA